jgi:hypothetical protein
MNKILKIHDGINKSNCEYCNKEAELRPYGKNGAWICFSCGMNNKEETEKNFSNLIKDKDIIEFNLHPIDEKKIIN